ncbi:MAG: DUF2795 domain-containing protein [Pseudonocardiales bacterium]
MERGSDQHGRLLDEAMKAEVEGVLRSGHSTRSDEFLDPEPSAEDQPDVDRMPDGSLVGGTPDGMTEADVAQRAEMAAVLGRCYPADRTALLDRAGENQAPDQVVAELQRLPKGRTYETFSDIWTALGHPAEDHRF